MATYPEKKQKKSLFDKPYLRAIVVHTFCANIKCKKHFFFKFFLPILSRFYLYRSPFTLNICTFTLSLVLAHGKEIWG
jgi:hypothetical protein